MLLSSLVFRCSLCVVSLAACNRDFAEAEAAKESAVDDRGTERDAEADVGIAPGTVDVKPSDDTGDADTSVMNDVVPPPNIGVESTSVTSDGKIADWSDAFLGVYDFESSGMDLGRDSSGQGHHLQLIGSPVQDADHNRGEFSALFDGMDPEAQQYLSIKADVVRTLDSPSVTVGAWIRTPLEIGPTDYSVVANGNEIQGGVSLRVRLDHKAVRCMIGAKLKGVLVDDLYIADYREWSHIVCRYDNDSKTVQYFVDGVASTHATRVPNGIGQGAGEFRIGENFTGAVDEVFFIKRALTDKQVARIWACGVNGKACSCSPSNTTAYETCGLLQDCEQAQLPPCDSTLKP